MAVWQVGQWPDGRPLRHFVNYATGRDHPIMHKRYATSTTMLFVSVFSSVVARAVRHSPGLLIDDMASWPGADRPAARTAARRFSQRGALREGRIKARPAVGRGVGRLGKNLRRSARRPTTSGRVPSSTRRGGRVCRDP